jgi:TonB family protein
MILNNMFENKKDDLVSVAISISLHAVVIIFLIKAAVTVDVPKPAILAIETVPGMTPLGSGSGAFGEGRLITDKPLNRSPLSGGMRVSEPESVVKVPEKVPVKKEAPKPQVQTPPTLAQLQQQYKAFGIGVDARQGRESLDELSEGGIGDGNPAGVSGGMSNISGPLGSRGYRSVDFSYNSRLEEETSLVLVIVVNPRGEVISRRLQRTSGYLALDQHVLSKVGEIRFDPLPPGVEQVDMQGEIRFRFDYEGKAYTGGQP